MLWVFVVVAVLAGAVSYAFRPEMVGSGTMWIALGVPYAALSAGALVQLRRRERLAGLFTFRRGDPSIGILLGLALLLGAWLFARQWLHGGSTERAWLFTVFLIPGDPNWTPGAVLLLGIVLCEEIVWRGWVQLELRERLGARRAWIAAAVLYSAAHAPTLITLRDPLAGMNPLLVLASLGCGLCWSFLVERTGRLFPALISHAVFSYFAFRSLLSFVGI